MLFDSLGGFMVFVKHANPSSNEEKHVDLGSEVRIPSGSFPEEVSKRIFNKSHQVLKHPPLVSSVHPFGS